MAISNLGELNTEVSILSGKMIDGQLSNRDTVAVINENGHVSTIREVKVEEHWAGEEGHSTLIGRTIWLVTEEM